MRRLSRFLLILILTVSLPVRGYAASIMMVCGASGPAAMAHSVDGGAFHHQTGHAEHSHDSAHQHAHGEHGAGSGNDDHDSATCSACGVCCAGVLFASVPAVSMNGAVSSGRIAFFDRRFVGFIPAGLDRPPLSLVR